MIQKNLPLDDKIQLTLALDYQDEIPYDLPDLYLYTNKRFCVNPLCDNPNRYPDGSLDVSEFSKDEHNTDGKKHQCTYCVFKIRAENTEERNQPILDALKQLCFGANKRDRNNKLTYIQLAAMLICQNYRCFIYKNLFLDDLPRMSLDHIVPYKSKNPNINTIENVMLCNRFFNFGKNGDDLNYAVRIAISIDKTTDETNSETKEYINRIHARLDNYQKVYDKIKFMSDKQLELTLASKISIDKLLKTSVICSNIETTQLSIELMF